MSMSIWHLRRQWGFFCKRVLCHTGVGEIVIRILSLSHAKRLLSEAELSTWVGGCDPGKSRGARTAVLGHQCPAGLTNPALVP